MRDRFRILRTPAEWSYLHSIWEEIIKQQSDNILGMDVTCTSVWAENLWENHLERRGMEIAVMEADGDVQAILPFCRTSKRVHSIYCRGLAPVTELYSGRCGFLLREFKPEQLMRMIMGIQQNVPDWDVFTFTLVEGSQSRRLLQELEAAGELRVEKLATQTSPYIMLNGDWEGYFSQLPKKFRWNLRNCDKKMRAAGETEYQIFEAGSNLDRFHDAVREIEKESWKEKSGTSLTANQLQESFHRRFMVIAERCGWFSGHLLLFRREAIAYVWGLLYGNIFYDFKESYKSVHNELGPGHVLKLALIERLFRLRVPLYDYMGVCEPYKLRWTDKTYQRSTFIVYNNTLRGQTARFAGKISARIGKGKQPAAEFLSGVAIE